MSTEKTCPKCNQQMARQGPVYAIAQRAPDDLMIEAGLRVNVEEALDVDAYRCGCGYIELYESDRFGIEPNEK
jgi:predicted nucleic-acid-binding Zn-ribbon protein